jgi:tetratricopeptide (TPR) repeat protein
MARRALELNPRLADAYINFAGVASARREYEDALRALDMLLSFEPTYARALAAKALTLKELDRLDEAMACAKRAVAIAPDAPESHNAVGQVYQAMGEFDPALGAYARAAELPGPAQMDAVANRSSLYVEFGRQAEGLEWMQKAAEAFPNSPGLVFGQTELRRFERGDPLIAKMQTMLAREGISLSDRITLNFGLGKACLDIGDSEAAFRHYDEGNRASSARPINTTRPLQRPGWRASRRRFLLPCSKRRPRPARVRSCPFSSSACRARAPR